MSPEGFRVLIVVLLVTTQCTSATLGDVFGSKIKDPICSSTEFYCPYDSTHHCKPRTARCLLESERTEQTCLNPQTQKEEGCRGNLKTGIFEIWDGWTYLFRPVSSLTASRSHHHRLKHEFVTYRGFTYEYSSRGVDIRDISDPNYRYNSQKVLSYKEVGTSECRTDDLYSYTSQWKGSDYNAFTHNCQHFADGLIQLLKSNCKSTRLLKSMYQSVIDTSNQEIHPHSDNNAPAARWDVIGSRVTVDQDDDRFVEYDFNQTRVLREKTNPDEDSVMSNYTTGLVVLVITVVVLAMAILVAMVIFKRKRTEEGKALLGDEAKM